MAGIFISYRRDDSAGHAGRLFDRLKKHFGAERVFMDVEGIAPGTDFVHAIQRAVAASDVVLAVIGPRWSDCTDEHGRRRLDDSGDFVRLEIASALRAKKTVVPVLVHEAQMPSEAELPADLRGLAHRQSALLTDAAWDSDIARLLRSLQDLTRGSGPSVLRRFAKALGAHKAVPAAITLVLALAATLLWRKHSADDLARSHSDRPSASGQTTSGNAARSNIESEPPAQEGNLAASTPALDFGDVRIGAPSAKSVRVHNVQESAAHLSRIGLAGAAQDDYAIQHTCGGQRLAGGTSCEVTVHFTPSERGARVALLSVEFFGRRSPLIVKLSGAGVSQSAAADGAHEVKLR